ncbi:MAG: hypothetical protein AAGF56_07055 [Pseudomonadota bacterium]
MDDFERVAPRAQSGGSGIGYLVAGIIVLLVLLYALFAGGGASTTVDPASVGTTETVPPTVEETEPALPTAPAVDN